ncbi:N-acetyltransferase [Priestia megaterium]|uniref:N-acetyltransferase n=1 Tax=Priestia megaterium TaxID=1404 RepID=UPI000BEC0214|nr:N-acetyltransferase [Priestia megaterium]MDW4507365.1 N-acetyltransferase [Priestia megaterium]PEC43661.1 GNAT family N-acetyltransferase [Priestia megaterium]CAH0146568.1 putative N-acetyltransferase YlbP [Priestia megaterium]
MNYEVKHLKINFKTLEEFKKFKEYGIQELSMLEELHAKISDNEINSPFYGIYFGNSLVARMSLYKRNKQYDQYFEPPQTYIEVWKLEVLSDFQRKGLGQTLVEYAKSFQLPIKTSPRVKSSDFWSKMGFVPVTYDIDRDLGENPLIWLPSGVSEQK